MKIVMKVHSKSGDRVLLTASQPHKKIETVELVVIGQLEDAEEYVVTINPKRAS